MGHFCDTSSADVPRGPYAGIGSLPTAAAGILIEHAWLPHQPKPTPSQGMRMVKGVVKKEKTTGTSVSSACPLSRVAHSFQWANPWDNKQLHRCLTSRLTCARLGVCIARSRRLVDDDGGDCDNGEATCAP